MLNNSNQSIVARLPPMSCYCHFLYAFLMKQRRIMHSCTLKDLMLSMPKTISSEVQFIVELLTTLSERGLIMFVKNQQQLEKSWIVMDIESLLKTVKKEVLLVLEELKNNRNLGSNTGIIHLSTLKQVFPRFSIEMLVGFMQTLQLCHCVNLSGNRTTIQSTEAFSFREDWEVNLFFPSFLANFQKIVFPINEDSCFGWCLYCNKTGDQYFTSEFLHVLLLRLAYSFPMASSNSTNPLQTRCTVWSNGIYWDNVEEINTTVELIDHNRCVMVVMSHNNSRPVEFCKHRSAVIRLVLDLKQQLCPDVQAAEYLTSRFYLRKWSSPEIARRPYKSDLLPIENVAISMLQRKDFIFTSSDIISEFRTKDALKSEPYFQLSRSSVCQLLDSSKADELVSRSLLDEVERICQVKLLIQPSHSGLRMIVDVMSIYAGKNPIIVGNVSIDSLLAISDPEHPIDYGITLEEQNSVTDVPTVSADTAYASGAVSDSELHDDSDMMTADILKLKEQQKDEEICSLQAKLKLNRQQTLILEDDLQAKQRLIEELQLKVQQSAAQKHSVAIQTSYLDDVPVLQGVDVCGIIVFDVPSSRLPQKLEWMDYGFYIEVPAGALPPGVTASVTVRAILQGQFKLPENRKLFSAIYAISCSEVFLKDVAVNIQHYACITNEEEASKFKFIIAKCSQGPPYKFVEKDGVFNAYTRYATIQRKRFSFHGVDGPDTVDYCYVAMKFYKQIPESFDIHFRFVVLLNFDLHIEKYKKNMREWTESVDSDQEIEFDGDCITLEIPEDSLLTREGWEIMPLTNPLKIIKSRLDKPIGRIPSCNFELRWTGSMETTPNRLFYKVYIRGTTDSPSYFIITHHPQRVAKVTQQIISDDQASTARHPLSHDDLTNLMDELKDVTDWQKLGLQFKMRQSILEQVKRNNHDNLADMMTDMLNRWLKSNPEAAWEDVVLALRKIDENRVAKTIEGKYCETSN